MRSSLFLRVLGAKSNEACCFDSAKKTSADTLMSRLDDLNLTDFEMTFDDLKRQNES